MAQKQSSAIDMNGLELLNPRAQNLAAAPGGTSPGLFWFNTTSGRIEFRGNVGVIDPTARANHTGTQTAATISDFDNQVRLSRLDQMAAPTAAVALNAQKITGLQNGSGAQDAVAYGQLTAAISALRLNTITASADVNFGGFKATNLANGSNASDAATWGQVQSLLNGTDWKPSVRAATTANITLSAPQTIDGIAVIAGERVLVKNQSTGAQNGIYVVAAGAWTRAADADVGMLSPASAVFVEEGTVNADTQWRITTDGAITVGSTTITWGQFGAGTAYTNGHGIVLTGNAFSIDTAVVTRKYSATIGDGAATSIVITHNLGTDDVVVQVREVGSKAVIGCDIVSTSSTQVTLAFAVAPALNSLRAVVHG